MMAFLAAVKLRHSRVEKPDSSRVQTQGAEDWARRLTRHELLAFFGCHDIHVYLYQNRGHNMLAIRLPAEVETRLEALAQATGRTKTFYAREAILEHLDDLEDLYLAEQRLIDIRAGRSRTYTLDEVERDLGLDD